MNSPMNPPMNNEKRLVVFTDLDGCLLDHDSYSFAPAAEALAVLAAQGIPLVLCSSKTRAEIEMLQQDLGVAHPFVSENGGALFLPRRYFPFLISDGRSLSGYQAIEFGLPYYQLVETLHRVASDLNIPVVGFSDMTTEEVAKDCKLPLMVALLAKLREYDEPFRILDSFACSRCRPTSPYPHEISRTASTSCRRGSRCSGGTTSRRSPEPLRSSAPPSRSSGDGSRRSSGSRSAHSSWARLTTSQPWSSACGTGVAPSVISRGT